MRGCNRLFWQLRPRELAFEHSTKSLKNKNERMQTSLATVASARLGKSISRPEVKFKKCADATDRLGSCVRENWQLSILQRAWKTKMSGCNFFGDICVRENWQIQLPARDENQETHGCKCLFWQLRPLNLTNQVLRQTQMPKKQRIQTTWEITASAKMPKVTL